MQNHVFPTQRSNSRNLLLLLFISTGLIVAIFIESSQPPLAIFGQISGLDKVAHFMAFGLLASLLYLIIKSLKTHKWFSPFVITIGLITTIGLSDELYQLLNPDRAFDMYDLLADISGAWFFVILLKIRNYFRSRVNP